MALSKQTEIDSAADCLLSMSSIGRGEHKVTYKSEETLERAANILASLKVTISKKLLSVNQRKLMRVVF